MASEGELSALDRLLIGELMARYDRALDGGDKDGFLALFAADGSWVSPMMGSFNGRAEIAAWFDTYLAGDPGLRGGQHRVSNLIVDPAGPGRATAWSNWVLIAAGPGGPRPLLMGNYLDDLIADEGRWLFARREIELTASAADSDHT